MKYYITIIIFFLSPQLYCQSKLNDFNLKDIELISCLPKIALIQNYLALKGFTFDETKSLGQNYDQYKYHNGNTIIKIEILNSTITSFNIKSSDKELIKNLHNSCNMLGYEKMKPLGNSNPNFNWWQKTVSFSRLKVRFAINGYYDQSLNSISYDYLIEQV